MLSWHYNFVSLKFEKHVYCVTVSKLLYVVCQILFSLWLNRKKKSWETGKQISFGWHNFTLSRQSIFQKRHLLRRNTWFYWKTYSFIPYTPTPGKYYTSALYTVQNNEINIYALWLAGLWLAVTQQLFLLCLCPPCWIGRLADAQLSIHCFWWTDGRMLVFLYFPIWTVHWTLMKLSMGDEYPSSDTHNHVTVMHGYLTMISSKLNCACCLLSNTSWVQQ